MREDGFGGGRGGDGFFQVEEDLQFELGGEGEEEREGVGGREEEAGMVESGGGGSDGIVLCGWQDKDDESYEACCNYIYPPLEGQYVKLYMANC